MSNVIELYGKGSEKMRAVITPSDWRNEFSEYPVPDVFAHAIFIKDGMAEHVLHYVAFIRGSTLHVYSSDDESQYFLDAVGEDGRTDFDYCVSVIRCHIPQGYALMLGTSP